MHKDCAVFALRTCPHLARAKGRYNLAAAMPSDALIVQGQMPAVKSEWFSLMRARKLQRRTRRQRHDHRAR
jgi:hypothetical protein